MDQISKNEVAEGVCPRVLETILVVTAALLEGYPRILEILEALEQKDKELALFLLKVAWNSLNPAVLSPYFPFVEHMVYRAMCPHVERIPSRGPLWFLAMPQKEWPVAANQADIAA